MTNSDISPVPVPELVDDSSGTPDDTQANKIPKNKSKGNHDSTEKPVWCSEIPEWPQEFREILGDDENSNTWRLSRQFFS